VDAAAGSVTDAEDTRPGSRVRPLVSGTALLAAGFLAASVMNLAFQVLVARHLPVADVGRYFESVAVVGILLAVAVGGLRSCLVRYVAVLDDRESAALGRRLVAADVLVAVAIGALVWLGAGSLSRWLFHDLRLAGVLRVMVVALPFAVVGALCSAFARGKGAFLAHFVVDQVSMPAVRLLALLVALGLGVTVGAVAAGYAAGFAASAVLGLVAARRLGLIGGRERGVVARSTLGEAARFAGFRWTVDVLQVLLLWADTLILGVFYPSAVPGVYSVSTRVVLFASIGLSALNLVVAPFAARALRSGDRGELSAAYAMAARWSGILVLVPLGLVLAVREDVLRVFGPAFVQGATPLAVLAIGFGVNAACGPAGVLLTMSSLNRVVLADNLVAVGLNVGLNLALVPTWGMTGAAVAWTSSLVVVNVLMLAQLRSRLGLDVLRRPLVRTGAMLGALSIAVALVGGVSPVWGLATALVVFPLGVVASREPGEWARVASVLEDLRSRPAATEVRAAPRPEEPVP
jgi:O-antigen/teichoic acid export membrane protein